MMNKALKIILVLLFAATIILLAFIAKPLLGRLLPQEGSETATETPSTIPTATTESRETAPSTEATQETETTQPSTEAPDPALKRADSILEGMTTREKLCQLIILNPDTITGVSPTRIAGELSREALERYPVGGFSFAQGNMRDREQTVSMLAGFQEYSEINMFFCLDEEGGRVWRVMKNESMGTTRFDSMFSYKDEGAETAYENAKSIGEDIGALGFNIDFAPVADVWSNPDNTVIGDRAYSDDPAQAAELIPAAIQGFHDGGIGCTLKHFPGHGDTETDSHKALPVVTTEPETLRSTAFLPFQAGIEEGVDFVMVGHILLTAVDEEYPASLSHEVVTGLLRDELGFDGVIITDSLGMGALSEYAEPERCVLALLAGCDILLGVKNIESVLERLQAALDSGELTMEQVDASVRRILTCKLRLGIIH